MNVEQIKKRLKKVESCLIFKIDIDGNILDLININNYKAYIPEEQFLKTNIVSFLGDSTPIYFKAIKQIKRSIKSQLIIEGQWDYLLEYTRYVRLYPNDDHVYIVMKKDPFLLQEKNAEQ